MATVRVRGRQGKILDEVRMSLRQRKEMRTKLVSPTRRADMIEPIDNKEPKKDKNIQLNAVDEQGYVPLHRAVVMKQYSVCQHLISKKVDINKKTWNGMTSLHLAARHGDVSAVEILLASDGCDLDAQDKNGWTSLHHCSINNHLLIAEMLLVAGADPRIPGFKNERAKDVAPRNEMINLIREFSQNCSLQQDVESGVVKKSVVIPRKGCVLTHPELGIEMEVPKAAIGSSLFFICRKIPATCCSVELGQSEVLISDVYEFWPKNISFNIPVHLEMTCYPVNEGEEVILKVNGDTEVSVFKDKQPLAYANRRHAIHRPNLVAGQETKHKFMVGELGRMYVVSRLHKETYKIQLIGTAIQHSELPDLSVTVPKNGLNSPATISFQVYPVANDLICQMQKQYPCVHSMGPVCEVTHTDSEPITRRLVNMTVPLPESYKIRKPDGKLVIVSGAGEGEPIEVIEKCHITNTCAEFLTRHLTWKAAVTVSYVDPKVLADVCESMRKYTRKRMHFTKYIVMYKTDICTKTCQVAFIVVTHGNEAQTKHEWLKDGFSLARLLREPIHQMMCEGEISTLTVRAGSTLSASVAFFSKQKSCIVLACDLPPNQLVTFSITNQEQAVLTEGEICA